MKTIRLSLFLALFGCLPAYAVADFRQRLDSVLPALMERYEAIGLSVAVVKDNKEVYHHSWGLRNREELVALQSDDVFRIFSISKSLVATAIMQLVERGQLSLQDDICRYLPWTVRNPFYADVPITLEMLLTHRSSINDSQGYTVNFDMMRPERNSDYALCYNQYCPGSSYHYSNLNYNLLGAVIERVTQTRFDQFIIAQILNPLHLHGFYDMAQIGSRHFAQAYQYNAQTAGFQCNASAYAMMKDELATYVLGESTPVLSPCGGVKMSAVELAEYMRLHINQGKLHGHRFLRKQSERKMWTVQSPESNYGMAFIHYTDLIDGEELIGHRGGGYGVNTSMFFHPKKKYGFVIFCNGLNTSLVRTYQFQRILVRHLYNEVIL